jgi:L-amino acid N-acyltransferase YncA
MSAFTVRTARAEDAAEIQAIYAPIGEQTPISFETEPPTVVEMAERIVSTLKTYPYVVADRDGTVLGYAYASAHRTRRAYGTSVDVTCYVAERGRRQGIGRALYADLLAALASAGYHAAVAGITLPNAASVGLHEAMGFEKVGVYREIGFKLGAYHDVGWWQRLL